VDSRDHFNVSSYPGSCNLYFSWSRFDLGITVKLVFSHRERKLAVPRRRSCVIVAEDSPKE